MKKSIQLFICSAFFLTTLANAQWSPKDRIKGNGHVITEVRKTTDYEDIKVGGFFDVDLVSGNEGTITLEGEGNLLSYLKVEVVDNTLRIYTEKNRYISPSKGKTIKITVPFESINQVSLSGSGDIRTKNTIQSETFVANLSGSGDLTLDLKSNQVEVNLSGSGDIVITGNTENLSSKLAGSGDIDASELNAKNVDVAVAGSGDSKVNCTESLKARVSGSGDIQYKGNPKEKDTKVNGSGEISKG